MIAFEEVRDKKDFDPTKLDAAPPFTQGWEYGEWQRGAGRNVRRLVGRNNGEVIASLQLVEYPLTAGKKYWYAPYGPVFKTEPTEELFAALGGIGKKIVRETGAVFARLDFSPTLTKEGESLAALHFRRAPKAASRGSFFQPRAEWVLDLTPAEEMVLRGMHPNTRYSIRAAERRGVKVEIVEAKLLPERFEEFYGVMKETAARDKFNLHPQGYYEAAFRISAEAGNAFLVLAKHGAALLAAHCIVCCGKQANFVFGGSSSSHREFMGSYAAQWAAIKKAKNMGLTRYNFGGVTSKTDARGGWEGLSSFKQKFGGRLLEHGPLWDIVGNKLWYYSYTFAKIIRNW